MARARGEVFNPPLRYLLEPTFFEVGLESAGYPPNPVAIRAALPAFKRIKTQIDVVGAWVGVRCPMSGLNLSAELAQTDDGPVIQGSIELQPYLRLAMAAFYVAVGVGILFFPAATMLDYLRGTKSASSIPYSFVASGILVGLGLFFARIQASARRISEIELVGAILASYAAAQQGAAADGQGLASHEA